MTKSYHKPFQQKHICIALNSHFFVDAQKQKFKAIQLKGLGQRRDIHLHVCKT